MFGSLSSRDKSTKSLNQTLPKPQTQVDNFFKESIHKFSNSPPRSQYHPKERNPILQTGEIEKTKKEINVVPIATGAQHAKGKALGQYYAQSKKSALFKEPSNEYVSSIKVIQPALYDKPQPKCLKKASWHPEPRDPILQESVTITPVRVRDKNFESTAFDHLGQSYTPDLKSRGGKYFDHMRSSVFESNLAQDSGPSRKYLGPKGEMNEIISYKNNQGFKDSINVKDPNANRVNKSELAQRKVLTNNAESYKYREMQSGVFS